MPQRWPVGVLFLRLRWRRRGRRCGRRRSRRRGCSTGRRGRTAGVYSTVTAMDSRPVVTRAGDRSLTRRGWWPGFRCQQPRSSSDPYAVFLFGLEDGQSANGQAVFLRFVDDASRQRHGLGRGLVDGGIVKPSTIEDGDGREPVVLSRRITDEFQQPGGPQFMRVAVLRRRREKRRERQQKNKAGLKSPSAI